MTTHQLHTLAARIAAEERITHREACARLGRRGRGKSRGGNYGRTTVGPCITTANNNVEKPAAVYWWQKDNS
jgi:hypothetical protein